MFINYLKVGIRNILKHKLASSINIIGLSSAIGVAVVAFLYLDWQYHVDWFHKNADNIYQVTTFMDRDGELEEWGYTPEPLGPAMKSEISQVSNFTRVNVTSGIFKYEDKVFEERVHFVDPQFLEIFSFPIDEGDQKVLYDPESILITGKIATKYFGQEDPIGKQITITFDRKYKETFIVRGITNKIPDDSALGYGILINYDKQKNIPFFHSAEDWGNFTTATFILTDPGASRSDISAYYQKYIDLQNNSKSRWIIEKMTLEPLKTLSLQSYKIRGTLSFGNQPHGNLAVAIIAFLLLVLACFNYMNVAVVSASTRLKEIALRKVVGSGRREIIVQFLSENLILCSFSLLMGLAFAYYFLLPGFNSLLPFDVPFSFSSNLTAFSFLAGSLLFVALISGAYPALFISSFKPVVIFRGNLKFGSKGWLSKSLLTVQFIVAFMTIVASLIFRETSLYFKSKDWGYHQNDLVVIPIDGEKHFNLLRDKFQSNPDIEEISGARDHFGKASPLVNIEMNNKQQQVRMFRTGPDYPSAMGLRLITGRFFNRDLNSDKQAILVNSKMVSKMGWQDPLQETLWYDSVRYHVIGVVENFHYYSFYNPIDPVFITETTEPEYNYFVAKTNSGSLNTVKNYAQQTWSQIEPDLPYDGFTQPEVFDNFYTNIDANIVIIRFVAILALVLSCMGLFGLVSFNISRNMKDFSIKRVLGAGTGVIINSVNRGFLWILVIAMTIGSFLAYLSMNGLLTEMFPDREPIGIWPIILGAVFIFGTAIFTVATQIYKVIKAKPVDTLRIE